MGIKLLGEETAESIVRACRSAIGDNLRSVTYFTRDDYAQLYLRSDLEQDADIDSFVGYEWRGFQTAQDIYDRTELGDYRYTIRAFENGYLIRVATEREGVFVTTDEVTLQKFEEVASALTSILSERLND